MKKAFYCLAALLLAVLPVVAGVNPQRDAYIEKYSKTAIREMRRTGVPASITLAQGILESGDGHGTLATKANNHFGIKCHKNWEGKTFRHDDDYKNECFRVYPDPDASYKDHSDFLRYNDRYKFLFDYRTTDYKSWAYGLKKAGYATDPKYPEKLIKIIEENQLYRFDIGKVQVESPIALERVQRVKTPSEAEELRVVITRPVYLENGVRFVYAMPGETYASIAQDNNLFFNEILGFNDLDHDTELLPGQMVYIQHKKSRTAKGMDKYIVDSESDIWLWDIAQRFGVTLKSLCRKNNLTEGYKLVRGQEIILR